MTKQVIFTDKCQTCGLKYTAHAIRKCPKTGVKVCAWCCRKCEHNTFEKAGQGCKELGGKE